MSKRAATSCIEGATHKQAKGIVPPPPTYPTTSNHFQNNKSAWDMIIHATDGKLYVSSLCVAFHIPSIREHILGGSREITLNQPADIINDWLRMWHPQTWGCGIGNNVNTVPVPAITHPVGVMTLESQYGTIVQGDVIKALRRLTIDELIQAVRDIPTPPPAIRYLLIQYIVANRKNAVLMSNVPRGMLISTIDSLAHRKKIVARVTSPSTPN
jgi:hypothetical protein